MNRWQKKIVGSVVAALLAVLLAGCTESNIPRGSIQTSIRGLASDITLALIPSTAEAGTVVKGIATVRDQFGNPAPDGTVVIFSGNGLPAIGNGSTAKGQAVLDIPTAALTPPMANSVLLWRRIFCTFSRQTGSSGKPGWVAAPCAKTELENNKELKTKPEMSCFNISCSLQ